ncbi:Hypothetical protein SMAX5B_008284 [Scophthalmus maximus]|uniref:Uncharacterized protein n=1 Tax=Scophthalmus maximus TaxID=52904 RepID=A0A2U9CWA0_SCOMX|nr:Hypothetical protein SMAX5B_008284 [Scophthalmus maximus]
MATEKLPSTGGSVLSVLPFGISRHRPLGFSDIRTNSSSLASLGFTLLALQQHEASCSVHALSFDPVQPLTPFHGNRSSPCNYTLPPERRCDTRS